MTAAAGLLAVARSSGRILLCRRSPLVSQPNTWAIPSGYLDPGETSYTAAMREFYEETACPMPFLVVEQASTFRRGSFSFTNFIGLLADEFAPDLNWENDEYVWIEIDSAGSLDLHFGTKLLIKHLQKKSPR